MINRQRLDELRSLLTEWAKRSAAALQRARTQQVDMAMVKASLARGLHQLRQFARREQTFSLHDLRPWLQQHGKRFALIFVAPIAALILLIVVNQQIVRLSHQLAIKPAQLNAIESLVQDSKSSGNAAAVPPLTDNDLETMRVILQSRGINPNILRLNLDSGIGIEIQADQAAFGQWVAFLDEIARRWQVYPVQLILKAGEQPEVVSIRGTLQQTQTITP